MWGVLTSHMLKKLRWPLAHWMWGSRASTAPHRGVVSQSTRQCGDGANPVVNRDEGASGITVFPERQTSKATQQGGMASPDTLVHRELTRIVHVWSTTMALSAQHQTVSDLAGAFARFLKSQPELVGFGIDSSWVKANYPLFCRWQGATNVPPHRVFAGELKRFLPRRRRQDWRNGQCQSSWTAYCRCNGSRGLLHRAGRRCPTSALVSQI